MSTDYPQQPPALPSVKKSQPWWIVWLILGMMVLFFGGCTMMINALGNVSSSAGSLSVSGNEDFTETVYYKDDSPKGKLAMVSIEGVITGQQSSFQSSMADTAISQIEQATEDESVKGLLLFLNTPGGEVTASDKIYHAAKKSSETGRPIVAYMDTVAASGGYYIACAADEILANETSITGSIGVIIGGVNAADMLDKIGVKNQTFRSGNFKDTLSMTREMRDDERVYVQNIVNDMYQKFAGIVSEARGIPMEKLKNGIADGRIFQGSAAKTVGLVDENGYMEDAIAALKKRANLDKAKIIEYETMPGIGDFLTILGAKAKNEDAIKVDWGQGQFTQNLKPFVPYMVLPGY